VDAGASVTDLGWDADALARLSGENYESELIEIDVSDATPKFWIQVTGPLSVQPAALERLRAALGEVENVEVTITVS
jgi:hypothetical protein